MDISKITIRQLEHMFLLTEEETCILKHGGGICGGRRKDNPIPQWFHK